VADHAKIIDEARQRVASGKQLDAEAYAARIRASGGDTDRALKQLARIVSVQRARTLVDRPPLREPAPTPEPLRPQLALRAKPTITGNMDVRRERRGEAFVLAWTAEPKVVAWDIRLSERPDVRSESATRAAIPPANDFSKARDPAPVPVDWLAFRVGYLYLGARCATSSRIPDPQESVFWFFFFWPFAFQAVIQTSLRLPLALPAS